MSESGLICVVSEPKSRSVTSETFTYESREAHKSRREFLQGGNVNIISHEHYVAEEDETSPQRCMDVYEVNDIGPLLSGKVLLEEGGDGPLMTHTYTYKHLR